MQAKVQNASHTNPIFSIFLCNLQSLLLLLLHSPSLFNFLHFHLLHSPFQKGGSRISSALPWKTKAMDPNSWPARLSSASKRYQSALQSRSEMKWDRFDAEMLMGFEEMDMDEDIREEYPCPFCSEYFDIVGLCCHIDDEHPVEANNGVCPVCAMRVGVDMVAHITLQHGNVFKMQRKRKSRKAGAHSTLSLLRRELREGHLRSLFGGPSSVVPSSSAAADPLLSSFILPVVDDFENAPSHSSTEAVKKSTTANFSDRKVQQPPMSIEDQEEKTKRCHFVQELLLSTILDDNL